MTRLNHLNTLTKATLPPLTLLVGEDVGLYAEMKTSLLQRIGYDPSDLGYAYFDLQTASYADIALELESLPFFSDDKVVILDNVQDLTTDKKSYLDEADLKQFEAYLERPSETTKLLILAAGKLDGKRRIVKLLKRDALVFDASPMDENSIRDYFSKKAAADGLVFEPGIFDALLLKAQYEFATLTKQLAFLSQYKLDRSAISQKDLDEAIPKSLQDNIFDLTLLTLSGRVEEALELVRDLRLQGEDEIKLIAVMLGQLRLFLQVQLLAQKGRSEAQVVAELSDLLGRKVNPYQVKFALRDSRAYPLTVLKKALVELISTDYQIKTGVYDKDYLFEVALLKIAGQNF